MRWDRTCCISSKYRYLQKWVNKKNYLIFWSNHKSFKVCRIFFGVNYEDMQMNRLFPLETKSRRVHTYIVLLGLWIKLFPSVFRFFYFNLLALIWIWNKYRNKNGIKYYLTHEFWFAYTYISPFFIFSLSS